MKRAFFRGAGPYLSKKNPELLLKIIEAKNWWPDQWLDQRAALRQVARTDFDRARQYFEDTVDRTQHKEEAYQYTRRIASEQGMDEAFAFISELENPIAISWGTRAAIRSWVDVDSVEATQYVNNIADPELRDYGALGVIDGIWRTNPEESLIWSSSIENGTLRQAAFVNLARAWQNSNQAEHIASLLAKPDLTPANRTAINTALQKIAKK